MVGGEAFNGLHSKYDSEGCHGSNYMTTMQMRNLLIGIFIHGSQISKIRIRF